MPSIHKKKLHSGKVVWELTHGRPPNRVRFVAGETKEQAAAVLADFKRQLALHGAAPVAPVVATALREYREHLAIDRRPGTARRYGRVLETFGIFLATCHPSLELLRDIKAVHIEDYKRRRIEGEIREPESREDQAREQRLREELAKSPESGTCKANAKYGWLGRKKLHQHVTQPTVNFELQCIHTFFHWAVRKNYLFMNPASTVEHFRIPRKSLPKFLGSEDLRKFLNACNDEERRVFGTMLLTGMRRGEVEYLTWNDINFEMGVILIQVKPDEAWQPKTDERIIPLSPTLQQILIEQFARRRSDKWVFANRDGNREIHLLPKLKKVCRRAGIRETNLHALRHSFGAHLRMAGVNLADIADLMGHKDLQTTAIYAKVQQEHLRSVINRLSPLVPIRTDAAALPGQAVAGHLVDTNSHDATNAADDVTPKCVTPGQIAKTAVRNLFAVKELRGEKSDVAGRQGFEPR